MQSRTGMTAGNGPNIAPPPAVTLSAGAGQWRLLAFCTLLSGVQAALLLTGPLYMMLVYDRVLSSESRPTLAVLTAIALFQFAMLALTEALRALILARLGLQWQARIEAPLLSRAAAHGSTGTAGTSGATVPTSADLVTQDIDTLRRLWSSPFLAAVFDLPFSIGFLLLLFAMDARLGLFALAAMASLAGLTRLNQGALARPLALQAETQRQALAIASHIGTVSGALAATGAQAGMQTRLSRTRQAHLAVALTASNRAQAFGAAGRSLRMALQSLTLGLGALLALDGQLSPGAIIAASVILGRALAPVESLLAHWPVWPQYRAARARLSGLLALPEPPRPFPLPRPEPRLELSLALLCPPRQPPGPPVLQAIRFTLAAGQVLAVIVPSGAGKTALARAISGQWPSPPGSIRLGGATPDQLGRDWPALIGVMTQSTEVYPGTIADNIARMDPDADTASILRAAEAADLHRLILALPEGYQTRLDTGGSPLSGGQLQRLALARALYGDPALLILDEPDASLDAEGLAALVSAMGAARAAGRIVVLIAHRPELLAISDQILLLDQGRMKRLCPRDELLRGWLPQSAPLPAPRTEGAA